MEVIDETRNQNEYAGFWLRLVAYIIDAILLGIVGTIIGKVFGIGGASSMGELPDFGSMMGSNVLSLIIGWLYFAYMESSDHQATLGKKVLNLKVTDLNGDKISFMRGTGRFFGKIISGLILLIGYIMAGFTEKKQALHDIMAGTLVYKK